MQFAVFESLHPLENARKNLRLPQGPQQSEAGTKNYREEDHHVSCLATIDHQPQLIT